MTTVACVLTVWALVLMFTPINRRYRIGRINTK
jgi:hypothetical protein